MTSDTTWRLIMVNSGENNNKFWYADREGTTVHRRWGRVGENGQKKDFHYGSVGEAIRKTNTTAQSKRRKGYRDLELVEGGEVKRSVPNRGILDIAREQVNISQSPELLPLIEYFVSANIHQITSTTRITYVDGQLKTPLGVIGHASIAQARRVLAQIRPCVERRGECTSLVEQYMTLVPLDIGRDRWTGASVFSSVSRVDEQLHLLDAMEGVTVAQSDDSGGVSERVFDVSMAREKDRDTLRVIEQYFRKTSNRMHSSSRYRLTKVYRVDIGPDRWDPIKGWTDRLWHGTKASNLLSIFRKGLRIFPSSAGFVTGRMFGNGIYFSDQSTKSLNYAIGAAPGQNRSGIGRVFMLLVDVSMGKAFTPGESRGGPSYGRPQTPPRGYDSIFAKGGKSGVMNNEMIVFSEDRAKIRYLCEFD